MPIATKGAVRSLSSGDLDRLGVQIVLANTYHLLCRPGLEAMRERGGLHRWMRWDRPMLTDSGGYQVFSLAKRSRATENGVTFQSHIDGARIELTPERSIAMQQAIGSDIMMQMDVVLSPDADANVVRGAMEQSVRWAKRCKVYLDSHRGDSVTQNQKLFGIEKGGVNEALRQESVDGLINMVLDGYAIGGLSVGQTREDNFRVAAFVANKLPLNKPRYFMGGGMPEEIIAYVKMGIDMFDCVIPTRHARHGSLFVFLDRPMDSHRDVIASSTKQSHQSLIDDFFYQTLNITNAEHAAADIPVDSTCDCTLCTKFMRSYLHHLFDMNEILGMRLATEHNVRFYMRLMDGLRDAIENSQI